MGAVAGPYMDPDTQVHLARALSSRPSSVRPMTLQRGLVLGGGGVTGIAWETGLLLGLQDLGVDVTTADAVVGTSAGSVVGAQITTGITLSDLFDYQVSTPKPAPL